MTETSLSEEFTALVSAFRQAKRKLILLDYDGTLVGHTLFPGEARPPDRVMELLLKLGDRAGTRLIVITGRGYQDIEGLIGTLPIILVAEHGAMIRQEGIWKELIVLDSGWKKNIFPMLRAWTEKCRGSFIEEKRFSLAWHYRNVEAAMGHDCSRKLIEGLHEREKTNRREASGQEKDALGLKIMDGKKVVEITTLQAGKGKAVLSLLEKEKYGCVVCIGDDVTDEDMFQVLKGRDNCFTIKVGEGVTAAGSRLRGVDEVLSLLERL